MSPSLTDFVTTIDPFVGTREETLRHYRAYVQILVGTGQFDVTDALHPFLISVRIRDTGMLEAEIELDDRDAKLPVPPHFTPLQISLGWIGGTTRVVFRGRIEEVWHDFGRKQGGRRMTIKGTGSDLSPNALIKMPMSAHMGDGAPPGAQEGPPIPLSAWLADIASRAGATIYVSPMYSQAFDDRWDQNNQSAMDLINQLAEQYHAVRPVRVEDGNHFMFLSPDDPIGTVPPDGPIDGNVIAKWNDGSGGNLIGWHLAPVAARPAWGGVYNKWFDTQAGVWKYVSKTFSTTAVGGAGSTVVPAQDQAADIVSTFAERFVGAPATFNERFTALAPGDPTLLAFKSDALPQPAYNFQGGEQKITFSGPAWFQEPQPAHNEMQATGWTDTMPNDRSLVAQGKVVIDGEPLAKFRGTVVVIGARPGVDGRYFIMEVEHNYSRQGYITTIDVGLRL